MGILSKFKGAAKNEKTQAPKAVLAAAMPLMGPGLRTVQQARNHSTTQEWQRQAWYFYDTVGELRAPVTWLANAVSKADVYAAELDPETGTVTGPTENAQAQAAASQVLGGVAHRAQLQQTIAIQWQVPGESFVIIRPRSAVRGVPQPDEWLVLSGSAVRVKGTAWEYTDPRTLARVTLGANDRLIRVWAPHPNEQSRADSSVRPALVPLQEIEKASQNIASRLDSRLAGNGLLFVPQEVDFPQGDAASVAQALMDFLYEAMEASLTNPGNASAQVPIVVTVPGEFIGQIQHLDIATAMDAVVTELRRDALSRLAATLDMPKPVAEGTQGDMNHWSAWQVSEDAYKVFIEPLLDRVGDALTEYWFRPALEAMGVQNPENYVLAWDTSSIVERPGQVEDLNWLYENILISDDYRRAQSGVPDDAVPDEDEKRRRELMKLVEISPAILAEGDGGVGQELFGLDMSTPDPVIDVAPAIESGQGSDQQEPSRQGPPATDNEVPEGLVAAAELVVFDALSRAGGRLLTRQYRGQFASTPKHELHTVIPVTDVDALLEGSFAFTDRVAEAFGRNPGVVSATLSLYVRGLLYARTPHDVDVLRGMLK